MNAQWLSEWRGSSPSGPDEAFYFDSGPGRLFGWLHLPAAGGSAPRLGMVICKPFGYEAVCAHRSIRAFAKAAAAVGIPTLRFDYLGTGDSAEIDPQADQLDVWSRDVVSAVAELQRRTGVERVCLLGFRLGGLLATQAAGRSSAVTALALVAPVISGRRYLRELRTTRLASLLAVADPELIGGAEKNASAGTAGIEVSGFSLSAATVESLGRTDLSGLASPPVSDALIIDRKDLPGARAWSDAMVAKGMRTEYVALPGFVEMMITAPQFATVPRAMIASMTDWQQRLEGAPDALPGGTKESSIGSGATSTALSLPDESQVPERAVSERPVFLGSEATLFGIVTEPPPGEQRRRAVILLNVGADHHIGASRVYVPLARHWARRGYLVMRLDLAGLGDSETRPGQPDNEVFPPAALDDIRLAIDFMHSRYRARDITLAGVCSGAYHALRAAAARLPVNRILMVNPQNYFWKQGMTLEGLQLAEIVRNPAVYRDRVLSLAAWRRMLHGEVNIWRIVRIYLHRPMLTLRFTLRDLARVLHVRMEDDLGSELEEIGARGVHMAFVFARGEPGLDLLKLEAGSSVKRLGERCRVHIIDSADHTFTQSHARGVLERVLSEELFARGQIVLDHRAQPASP
jgi:alpha-beta hydrolase superfamily lysophospholipase